MAPPATASPATAPPATVPPASSSLAASSREEVTEATGLFSEGKKAAQPAGRWLPLYLVMTCASITASAIGLWVFLRSAFVVSGGPTPSSPRSYTLSELMGIIIFVAASPFVLGSGMGSLLLQRKGPCSRQPALAAVPLAAACACAIVGLWSLEGREMVSCGFVWCYAAPPSTVDPSGFMAIAGGGLVAVAVLMLAVAAGLLWADTCQPSGLLAELQCAQRWKVRKRRASALALLVALPLTLLLCGVLPNTWERFSRSPTGGSFHSLKYFMAATGGVNGIMKSEKPGALMVTVNWQWSQDVVVKLFPDTLLFYGFLEGVVLVSALAAEFPAALGRPLSRKLGPMTAGRWLLDIWFAVFLFFFIWYWARDHVYHADGKFDGFSLEVAARTFGVTAVMLLGLLLLPASKSSPVLAAAGLSWESSLWMHITLGVLFLAASCGHVVLFFARFLQLGYPADILPFNSKFWYPQNPVGGSVPSDNWTVPMMSTVFWPSLLCFGVFPWLRRKSYELFRYSHYMSVILVPALLWHATNSWYFIFPGMLLWTADRVLRLLGACEMVSVHGMEPLSAELPLDPVLGRPPEPELITKLTFTWPGQARVHSPGMYVLVNFPQLALHEWHPFSLSSSPEDTRATLHVKSMGELTFTGRLHDLARSLTSPSAAVMNVQGPYGPRVALEDSPRVLLVAGGIGITAMLSAVRCAVQQGRAGQHGRLQRLRLVWVVRSAALADLLATELSEGTAGLPFELVLSVFCSTAAGEEAAVTCRLGKTNPGRPDFAKLIDEEVAEGQPLLVRACGPTPMMAACIEAAEGAPGDIVDYEPWSFVL